VAFGARFLAWRGDIYAPAMFCVAGGTIRRARLISVVDRAVMARETSLILDLRRKYRSPLDVACRALFFEDGVRRGHAAAAVYASIFVERVPGNPHDRQDRQKKTQPELGAFQWRRSLEIVEIDALSKFFGGARSSQVFSQLLIEARRLRSRYFRNSRLNISAP
jgi:hypothetical protein